MKIFRIRELKAHGRGYNDYGVTDIVGTNKFAHSDIKISLRVLAVCANSRLDGDSKFG